MRQEILKTLNREELICLITESAKKWAPSVGAKARHAKMFQLELNLYQATIALIEMDKQHESRR